MISYFQNKFSNTIITPDVVLDLEILEGLGLDKTNSILSHLDRTSQQNRKIFTQKIITHPTDDTTLLQKRQEILKMLVSKLNYEMKLLPN